MPRNVLTIILVSIIFLFDSSVFAKDTYKWPHEVYKKEAYPNAKFGTLKNGFRYVIIPNKSPEKRVLVELLVEAGSLMEHDAHRGIAHFLEHMAFNGTKNFPGNSIIDFFKKIGMTFGGDTNAHTGFDETVYELNLPDESHMEDGLKIMADYAQNITFDKEEIEKERGIILSEKRTRDNIQFRLLENELHFSLGGTLVPNRFPIGTKECIDSVQQKDFIDFYKAWYRPSKMVLFIVGDVDSKAWEKLVKKIFKELDEPSGEVKMPNIGSINHEGLKINYIYEEESSDTKIDIGTLFIDKPAEPEKIEDYVLEKMADSAAIYITNQRLQEKLQKADCPAINAQAYTMDWIYDIKAGSISAHCKPENWEKTLHLIEQEIRSVLTYGVLDFELELFKKDMQANMDKAVKKMGTISSNAIMNSAQSTFKDGIPLMNDLQKQKIQLPLLNALTKDLVLARLKYYWNKNHRLISITGNLKLDDAKTKIGEVWNSSSDTKLKAPVQVADLKFPYLPAPTKKVEPEKDFSIQDLDIRRIKYANNIILNIKETDFKTNEIKMKISFGKGALSVPEGKENLVHIANIFFGEDGLGKLTKTELQKALTGKSVDLNFHVNATNFSLSASTTKEDFELQLDLLRTFLLDPGFHPDTKEQTLKKLDQFYNEASKNPILYFRYTFSNLVSAGDPTYELALEPRITDFDQAALKDWLMKEFKSSEMEISICGDIKQKDAIDLVSRYFGTLPEKEEIKKTNRKKLNTPAGVEITKDFDSTIPKSIIAYQIQTTDFYNISDVRLLNMLGQVMAEKLRKRVREELSISYSPSVRHSFNESYVDNCAMQFFADVNVGKESVFIEEIEKLVKSVTTVGITEADLQEVIKSTLNHIMVTVKTNSYWLDRVLVNSSESENNFEMARNFKEAYEKMKVEDVNKVAKKYLDVTKALKFTVKSQKQNVGLETK